MLKKIIPLLIVALLISFAVVGCGDEEIVAPIELVPQSANMLGRVDLVRIMEDEDIASFYDAMEKEPDMPQTFDEAMDMLGGDFEELVLFGDISEDTWDEEYFGMIVKGTFTEADVLAAIEELGEVDLVTTSYRGYEVYMDATEDMQIVFLSAELMVIGSMDAVEDVILVKDGELSAISGEVLDAYNDLGSVLFKLAMVVPEELTEEGFGDPSGELPGMDAFGDIETMGISLDKVGELLSLDLQLCFPDSESAEEAKSMFDFVMAMAGMAAMEEGELEQAIIELLQKIEMTVTGSCLDIVFEITLTEIEELVETFEMEEDELFEF